MSNLNQGWLALIIGGVIFLFGYIGLNIYESVSGIDREFTGAVVPLERNNLMTKTTEDHFRNYSRFSE